MEADTLPVHLHRVSDGHIIFLQLHKNQMTLKGTTYHMHHSFPPLPPWGVLALP